MFGLFARKLTEYSNHLIDWSRIGELLHSSHHYSKDELVVRASIILATATSAFLGAYLNDKEKTQTSDITLAIASGCLGFVVSHAVVIIPLVRKRQQMRKECLELVAEIKEKTLLLSNESPEFSSLASEINSINEYILSLSLSDEKHAKASQTWGWRKRLLLTLKNTLEHSPENIMSFWQNNTNVINRNDSNNPLLSPKH